MMGGGLPNSLKVPEFFHLDIKQRTKTELLFPSSSNLDSIQPNSLESALQCYLHLNLLLPRTSWAWPRVSFPRWLPPHQPEVSLPRPLQRSKRTSHYCKTRPMDSVSPARTPVLLSRGALVLRRSEVHTTRYVSRHV